MLKSSEKKLAYQKEYDKKTAYAAQVKYQEKIYRVGLSFAESDGDIIEKLKSVGNKTDYVRKLILEDIGKE